MHDAFRTLKSSAAFYLVALILPINLYYTSHIMHVMQAERQKVQDFKTVQNLLHLLTHPQLKGLEQAMRAEVATGIDGIDRKWLRDLNAFDPDLLTAYGTLADAWERFDADPKAAHECWRLADRFNRALAAAVGKADDRMLESLYLLLLASMIATIGAIYIIRNQMKLQIERHSMFDAATGLFNRGYFDGELLRLIALSRRHGHALSLVTVTLGRYEELTKGQLSQKAPAALREFGALMRRLTRQSDVVCRYGDDVFVIIAPETDLEKVTVLAERIRNNTAQSDLEIRVGTSEYEEPETVDTFVDRAAAR